MAQKRTPKSCPPGWLGRYRVATGDSLANIARFFRRPLSQLQKVNPHIKNPNLLIPGDILCVPGLVPFPCSVLLEPTEPVPTGTEGLALIHIAPQGGQSVTITAILPQPSHWGNYNRYLTEVFVNRATGKFASSLFPLPSEQPTWSGTIPLPTVVSLTPNSRVRIIAANTKTGTRSPTLLLGSLNSCLRPELSPIRQNKQLRGIRTGRKRRSQTRRR